MYQFLLNWASTFLFEMLWVYGVENTYFVHSVNRVFIWQIPVEFLPCAVYHAELTVHIVTLYSAAMLNSICKCSLKKNLLSWLTYVVSFLLLHSLPGCTAPWWGWEGAIYVNYLWVMWVVSQGLQRTQPIWVYAVALVTLLHIWGLVPGLHYPYYYFR